jgi:hypothetical protein
MKQRLRNIFWIYSMYTSVAGFLLRKRFRNVHTLLLFIGYPRSGSSTLGSILDAHENISIAHELNALKYIQLKYSPRQLFYLLAKNSKQVTLKGRLSSGYKGIVKGQYNGKTKQCLVIGDKKAGATSKMLRNNPALNNQLLAFFSSIKLIHIVRNPYDMIATQAYSGNEKQLKVTKEMLSSTIEFYAVKFSTISKLLLENSFDIYTIKHEELLKSPEPELRKLLYWLGIEGSPAYYSDCSKHLYPQPHKSRNNINWTEEQIESVNLLIQQYDFLNGYSFTS